MKSYVPSVLTSSWLASEFFLISGVSVCIVDRRLPFREDLSLPMRKASSSSTPTWWLVSAARRRAGRREKNNCTIEARKCSVVRRSSSDNCDSRQIRRQFWRISLIIILERRHPEGMRRRVRRRWTIFISTTSSELKRTRMKRAWITASAIVSIAMPIMLCEALELSGRTSRRP